MPRTRRRSPARTRARSRAAADKRKKATDPVRLYIVEDQVYFVETLRTSPALPAQNIKLVGASAKNVPDLAKRVTRAKADVVLIDIDLGPARTLRDVELGNPLENGLAACEALKRALPGIRVLVWSYLGPQARDHALQAGADHFEARTLKLSTLLQTIKRVARNQPILTQPSTTFFGRIVAIRLATRDRRLTAEDGADRAVTVKLKPVGFALVWYLALERLAGANGWLKPDYPERSLVYRIEKPSIWRRICAAAGVAGHDLVVPNTILNNWKTGVRESLRAYGKIELFGSNQGRPAAPPQCSLIHTVRQTAIDIDDPDSVTQALVEVASERSPR